MPIRFTCGCGSAISAPEAMAGKKAKCPGCQKDILVPAAGAPPPAPPKPAQPQPAARPGAPARAAGSPGTGRTVAPLTNCMQWYAQGPIPEGVPVLDMSQLEAVKTTYRSRKAIIRCQTWSRFVGLLFFVLGGVTLVLSGLARQEIVDQRGDTGFYYAMGIGGVIFLAGFLLLRLGLLTRRCKIGAPLFLTLLALAVTAGLFVVLHETFVTSRNLQWSLGVDLPYMPWETTQAPKLSTSPVVDDEGPAEEGTDGPVGEGTDEPAEAPEPAKAAPRPVTALPGAPEEWRPRNYAFYGWTVALPTLIALYVIYVFFAAVIAIPRFLRQPAWAREMFVYAGY